MQNKSRRISKSNSRRVDRGKARTPHIVRPRSFRGSRDATPSQPAQRWTGTVAGYECVLCEHRPGVFVLRGLPAGVARIVGEMRVQAGEADEQAETLNVTCDLDSAAPYGCDGQILKKMRTTAQAEAFFGIDWRIEESNSFVDSTSPQETG
jgi:hypothetical protein